MSYDFLEDAGDSLSKCGFPYAMVMINEQGSVSLMELAETTKDKQLLILALRKLANETEREIFR